jgi:HAD superfamily, subfamily IIIB (Acid phosphatase)
MEVILFDIDGTLANNKHRKHYIETPGQKKNWKAFRSAEEVAKDVPFPHMVTLSGLLVWERPILFVTGRYEYLRKVTVDFLRTKVVDQWPYGRRKYEIDCNLYMRPDDDNRADYEVKSEICDQLIAKGYEILCTFDDRDSVVKMWRDRGIPCMQVAEGDF